MGAEAADEEAACELHPGIPVARVDDIGIAEGALAAVVGGVRHGRGDHGVFPCLSMG